MISHTDGGADGNVAAPFIGANGASWDAGYEGKARIYFSGNVGNADAIIDAANNEYAWPTIGLTREDGQVEEATFVSADDLKKQETYEDMGWDMWRTWTMDRGSYPYPVLMSLNGFTTGIAAPEVEVAPIRTNALYNLQGQRVSEGYKGIVIKNGQKMLVK